MESNINNKNSLSIMKKTILILSFIMALFIILPINAQAVEFNESYYTFLYDFEQGSGGIIQDISNNSHDGEVKYLGDYSYLSPSVEGDYGLDFSDKSRLETSLEFPADFIENITYYQVHFKIRPTSQVNNGNVLWTMYDNSNEAEVTLAYIDNETLQLITHHTPLYTYTTTNFSVPYNLEGVWNTFNIIFDFEVDQWRFYMNNNTNVLGFGSLTNFILPSGTFYTNMGGRYGTTADRSPIMFDYYGLFNAKMTEQQIINIHNYNSLVVPEITPEPINETLYIINEPQNNSININPINFNIEFSDKFDCEIYLNNSLFSSFLGVTSHSKNYNLEVGTYESYYYCTRTNYIENENVTNSFITERVYFEVVTADPSQVSFQFTSNDFNVNSKDLYLTTPCLKKGIAIPLVNNGYNLLSNPDPIKFTKVQDGLASMIITGSTNYEFCLVHGNVQYNSVNATNEWVVNKIYSNLDLGEYYVPSNIVSVLGISLTNFDVYKLWTPQAWGFSWVEIIGSLILFVLGLTLIIIGVIDKDEPHPKIVFAGVILILTAFGYSVGNLIVGVIF